MKGWNILQMSVALLLLFWMVNQALAQETIGMESTATAASSYFWRTATVDSNEERGRHNAIAFHPTSGIPWISYYDEKNKDLMVAHRVSSGGNCGPNNEWYCEVVDSTGDVGQYSSIDVAPLGIWKVGVAYHSATTKALKYAEYKCVLGSCYWSTYTIDQGDAAGLPGYGRYTSIKYDKNGTPHIVYYVVRWQGDIQVQELRYAYRRDDPGGNCGPSNYWACSIVDSGKGEYASLDIDDALRKSIAYYDGANGDLKLAKYKGSGGTGCTSLFWSCETIDGASADVGASASFKWDTSAKRYFAYYDATNGKLKYAHSVSAGSGNCGPDNSYICFTIDDAAPLSGSRSISLAMDGNNHPLIAYRYASGYVSQLRVAQPVSDLSQANCGVPDGGSFKSWRCFTVAAESFKPSGIADDISAAFDHNDLPLIAYSSYMVSSSDTDLEIAYGRLGVFLPFVMRNYP